MGAVPVVGLRRIDQLEIGLVDQGRRVERLAGAAPPELLAGLEAQLVIDQRQQLVHGVRLAVARRHEDPRDLTALHRHSGPAFPSLHLQAIRVGPLFSSRSYKIRAGLTIHVP